MSEQLSLITYMMGDNQRSIRQHDYSHLPPALRKYLEDRTRSKGGVQADAGALSQADPARVRGKR